MLVFQNVPSLLVGVGNTIDCDTFDDATPFKEKKCDYWDKQDTYSYFMRFVAWQEAGSKPK